MPQHWTEQRRRLLVICPASIRKQWSLELQDKFNLFTGVFGASDEVLGTIESGVDFEKRILAIYQQCRTPGEIEAAFQQLRAELESSIKSRIDETRRILLEHFDEEVHARLRVQLDSAREQLDRFGKLFWALTKFILRNAASFDDQALHFDLHAAPCDGVRPGRYHLISKSQQNVSGEFLYRLSHPLGQHALSEGRSCPTPLAEVAFDITSHPTRLSVVEALKGNSGWLVLQRLVIESFDREEYLLFSALDDSARPVNQETCEKLFLCNGKASPLESQPQEIKDRLGKEAQRHVKATISRSLEMNNRFLQEERERLEKWAEDKVLAAEKELADTKAQIRALNRQARMSATTEEQHQL
ncbi:MAG: hypothetical protein HYU36_10445 [Planctomycetes bacterium]|nr:hypothetical protein [Planctomycetota bacterium]